MALLLLIPSIALAFSAVGFVKLMVREFGARGPHNNPVRRAFWAACCAAGAVALATIATGRLA